MQPVKIAVAPAAGPTFLVEPKPFHAPALLPGEGKALPPLPPGDTVSNAFRTVRNASALVSKETKYLGDGYRIPFPLPKTFLSAAIGAHLALGTLGVAVVSAFSTGAAGAETGMALSFMCAVPVLAGVAGAFARARAGLQRHRAAGRELTAEAVEPLRRTFDAPQTTPLQRMVLGEVAALNRAELDRHGVKGDAARAVLDDLAARGSAVEASDELRQAASAVVATYVLTHDVEAERVGTWFKGRLLEDILAQTPEPHRSELRTIMYDLARADGYSDDDWARRERFQKVLTGAQDPRTIASENNEHRERLPGATRLLSAH